VKNIENKRKIKGTEVIYFSIDTINELHRKKIISLSPLPSSADIEVLFVVFHQVRGEVEYDLI